MEGQATKVTSLRIGQALHADARKKNDMHPMFTSAPHCVCRAMVRRERALHLYWIMQKEPITLDDITLICILQACCKAGSLEACRQEKEIVRQVWTHFLPMGTHTLGMAS